MVGLWLCWLLLLLLLLLDRHMILNSIVIIEVIINAISMI
jgi:hypothetical protein